MDLQLFSCDNLITELQVLQSEPLPPGLAGYTGLGSCQGSSWTTTGPPERFKRLC